jgi:hypothetical protein
VDVGLPLYWHPLARYLTAEARLDCWTLSALFVDMHYNAAGIYYEQEAPAVLTDWRGRIVLAKAVHASLERFSFRESNLRNQKETDWPSYILPGFLLFANSNAPTCAPRCAP